MAIYIEIRKLSHEDSSGHYRVFTRDFGGAIFYMAIDIKNKLIIFYLGENFLNPVLVIDCKNETEKIEALPSISKSVTERVTMRALTAINEDSLPDILDYMA